jgi:tetratricopeptide (TPR) repeat protein
MKEFKMLKKKLFLFVLIINVCSNLAAQDNTNFDAKDYLKYKDYNRALVEFLKVYPKNTENLDLNLKIGICYLNINDDKSKALPYLKKVYDAGGYKNELLLYMGLASMHAHLFDDAIRFFNDYRAASNNENAKTIERYLNNCENAKALTQNPKDIEFINLGKNINTKFPDFYPFITHNEGTLYFTSGRETNEKKIESSTGFFTYDIYYSIVSNGEWSKAKGIGRNVNTVEDEQCVYVTPDGENVIMYMDNENQFGDLFISSTTNSNSFSKPERFPPPVNTKSLETEGCITSDGNRLIVASDRPGGFGETDLYIFRKLPNGKWGLPYNIGSGINTKYKEDFPVYDQESSTLYFASEGHSSMGGFDIFKSVFDETTQSFGPVINMGYPLNNTDDNMQFSLAGNKRDGYASMYRKEGFGDLDIYKVIFHEVEVKLSIIKGVISTTDTVKNPIDAFISIIDAKTKEEIDGKSVNPSTGKYVFAVKPGKYIINVTSPGFVDYSKLITVFDKSDYTFEIENKVLLHRPDESLLPAGKVLKEKKEFRNE